jgi:hypothetical protein
VLTRQTLYHLAMPQPFFALAFQVRGLCFGSGLASDQDPPTSASPIAGTMDMREFRASLKHFRFYYPYFIDEVIKTFTQDPTANKWRITI